MRSHNKKSFKSRNKLKRKFRFSKKNDSTILQNIVYWPQRSCCDRVRSIIDLIDFDINTFRSSLYKPTTDISDECTDCYKLSHLNVYCFPCDLLFNYYIYRTDLPKFKKIKITDENCKDVSDYITRLFIEFSNSLCWCDDVS